MRGIITLVSFMSFELYKFWTFGQAEECLLNSRLCLPQFMQVVASRESSYRICSPYTYCISLEPKEIQGIEHSMYTIQYSIHISLIYLAV
jgi:hypothetical protein